MIKGWSYCCISREATVTFFASSVLWWTCQLLFPPAIQTSSNVQLTIHDLCVCGGVYVLSLKLTFRATLSVQTVIVKYCSHHWTVWCHLFLSEKLTLYQHLNVIICYMGRRQPKVMHRASPSSNIKTVSPPTTYSSPTAIPPTVSFANTLRHPTQHQCWLTEVSNCVGYLRCVLVKAHSALAWPSAPTHLVWC